MDPPTNLETSGFVSSRFVSQKEIDEAAQRKQEEWKAAYARLGQEPPPQEAEGEYDPRSLYERLNVQKETKREQWDEKMRMANQFRGLESDELQFLDEVAQEEREKQRRVERQDAEELAMFKSEVTQQPSSSSITTSTAPNTKPAGKTASSSTSLPRSGNKVKSLLKGVIRKKDTSILQQKTTTKTPVTGQVQPFVESEIQNERNGNGNGNDESSGKRKRSVSDSKAPPPQQQANVLAKRPPPPKATTAAALPPALGALGGYSSGSDDEEEEQDAAGTHLGGVGSAGEGDHAKTPRLA
ncbi:hypothetical protein QFC22_003003 [Naganishia vaughanmartiniae]|uniref:Uncharacterized protein n=1 Tax=Naganishia vaughanmartiniae TaxID=1424756 RepID=A0ACC2X9N6_9TREE|nr:hypothetical protein QFC22_003003 [Naganishia vaughanmartiniae]